MKQQHKKTTDTQPLLSFWWGLKNILHDKEGRMFSTNNTLVSCIGEFGTKLNTLSFCPRNISHLFS